MHITVMNRSNAVLYCYFPHPTKTIIISLSDPSITYKDEPFASDTNGVQAILRLMFADADRPGPDVYGRPVTEKDMMNEEHAKAIKAFLHEHPNTDIIVHCDAGISRSAGVAAGIMKALTGDDSPIFDSHRYRPNMWCYRKTLEALMD